MMVKLYAFTCGTVTGEFAHLMEGGEGDITVPIPVRSVDCAYTFSADKSPNIATKPLLNIRVDCVGKTILNCWLRQKSEK